MCFQRFEPAKQHPKERLTAMFGTIEMNLKSYAWEIFFSSNVDGAIGLPSKQHHSGDTFVTGFLTSSTRTLPNYLPRQNCTYTIYRCSSYGKIALLSSDSCNRRTEKNPLPPFPHLFMGPHNVYIAQRKKDLLKATRAKWILLYFKITEAQLSCHME